MYKVIVEVDVNDGDSFEQSYEETKERVDKIKKMISKIDRRYGIYTEDYHIPAHLISIHNLTDEDVEWWQYFLPNNELTQGYSKLEAVTILPIAGEEVLY